MKLQKLRQTKKIPVSQISLTILLNKCKTGHVNKSGKIIPDGDNELEDVVEELVGMDTMDLSDSFRVSNNFDS